VRAAKKGEEDALQREEARAGGTCAIRDKVRDSELGLRVPCAPT